MKRRKDWGILINHMCDDPDFWRDPVNWVYAISLTAVAIAFFVRLFS